MKRGDQRCFDFWCNYEDEETITILDYNEAFMIWADLYVKVSTKCELRITGTGGRGVKEVEFKFMIVCSNKKIDQIYK
jgi:hypothetical protein